MMTSLRFNDLVIFLVCYLLGSNKFILVESVDNCQKECSCSATNGSAQVDHMDCNGAGLTRFPVEIPAHVKILDLRRNFIETVDTLQLSKLHFLHTLYLSDNRLRHLDEYFLDSIPSLRRLYLSRNRLRNLPSLSQTQTSRIHSIDLHANHLHHIRHSAFDNLHKLEHLNIGKNFLQNLPAKLFGENFCLKSFHLENNPWNCDCRIIPIIKLLHARAAIEQNARHVNGHLTSSNQTLFLAKCQNPGVSRGIPIRELRADSVKCNSAIIKKNDNGGSLLECNLSGNSNALKPSATNVEWLYRNEPLSLNLNGQYELMENGSLSVLDEEIDLNSVECAQNYILSPTRQSRQTNGPHQKNEIYDQHYYSTNAGDQTPAKNNTYNFRIGANQHNQQQLRRQQQIRQEEQRYSLQNTKNRAIAEGSPSYNTNNNNNNNRYIHKNARNFETISAPVFTYAMRDRIYREGSAVKLNCEVVGHPRPRLTWRFVSSSQSQSTPSHKNTVIESSRKFQLRNDDTELTIFPFLEHDVGHYFCVAENPHGRIEASASIGLVKSQPPVIFEGPNSIVSKIGQRVLFKCKARGEPLPVITWFFDGSEISATENNGHYRISSDGSELAVEQVSRHDKGSYSCMAGNSVGSMTADAQLRVESSQLDALDMKIDSELLKGIVGEASANIARAITQTKDDLKQSGVSSAQDLLRHFKFTTKRPVELTKAREIYEESLRLIEKHVERGLQLKSMDLPTNISYESVLSVTHIQTIMELSGCMNGQFREACNDMCFHSKFRSYTGQCNNFDHPTWGVSQMPFYRLLPPIYENGFNTPVGWDPERLYFGYRKPNPRTVSMELIQTQEITPHHRFSAMLMQWGQFIDHDLDFTATALARQTYSGGAICNRTCENVAPCFNIPLPLNDPRRIPEMKFPCIEFERSAAICGSGETSPIFHQITYREQTNTITSFIDASNVYGSTEVDAIDLRDLYSDHGLLRFDIVSSNQKPYMPFEKDSAMDCRRNRSVDNPIRCFLSGDVRVNEQLGLTTMHTVWFREHNRIAARLLDMNADWDGERIYQEARKIVGAMMQHITYQHFLPKVIGEEGYANLIGKYGGYDSSINPAASNAFATAAFRFGHTIINPKLERLDENFNPISAGHLMLHDAFFAPERLLSEGGVDPILRGLFASPLKAPKSGQLLNKELTEKLFNRAHNVSLDLAVMNIQRGRDHGLPGYLEYRRFCNLTVPNSWEELAVDIQDNTVLMKLKSLYGHPGNIDLFVGGIVERRLSDALVGPTFSCIIADQFRRVRDGDRFWYENPGVFTQLQLNQLKKVTLAKVICNNGDSIDRVQTDVFVYPGNDKNTKMRYKKCSEIGDVDLRMWMSCCDSSCSARGDSSLNDLPTIPQRKRRAQHLYAESPKSTDANTISTTSTPLEKVHNEEVEQNTVDNSSHCTYSNALYANNEQWNIGKCTICKCENGSVWCSQLKNCFDG